MPRVSVTEGHNCWLYWDSDLQFRGNPVALLAWDRGAPQVTIPQERSGDGWVVRPWRLWINPYSTWKPEYDAMLTWEKRLDICHNMAAWLTEQGDAVQVEPEMPSPENKFPLQQDSECAIYGLLEFLLLSGTKLKLPLPVRFPVAFPDSQQAAVQKHIIEHPVKWHRGNDGSHLSRIEGPVPVTLIESCFSISEDKSDPSDYISVNEERVEAVGATIWQMTIHSA